MFFYFFKEYKTSIYRNAVLHRNRNIPKGMLVLIFSPVVLWIGGVTLLFTPWYLWSVPLLILCSVPPYLYDRLNDKRKEKQLDVHFEEYQKNRLQPLIQLLKEDKYDFYHAQQIDWLIHNCETNIPARSSAFGGKRMDVLKGLFFPILMFFLGMMVDKVDLTTALTILVACIMGLGLLLFSFYAFDPLIEMLRYPEREIYHYLKGELEYIRTTLP